MNPRNYTLEIVMKGTPRETWRALTDDVNTWWLADFHMLSPDSVVSFEARAGGALLEQGTDGRSLLWYTVQMAVPNESLHLVGHIGPDWGGPATSMLSLTLETRGVETVLSVRDALFGHTTDELVDSLCDGWRQLFTDDLKAHLEG